MRRIAVAVISVALALTVTPATAQQAPGTGPSASSTSVSASPQKGKPCATRKEFRRVGKGMRFRRVKRIMDSRGHLIRKHRKTRVRRWRACRGKPYYAQITFKRGRVVRKYAFLTGRRCATRKEYRRVDKGMRFRRVKRIMDSRGRVLSRDGKTAIRRWNACKGSPYYAQVTFKRGRVVTKYGFFN